MRRIIYLSIFSFLTAFWPAKAQVIVEPMVGCGSGCQVYQKQIGTPFKDKNGLRKVLVMQTEVITPGGEKQRVQTYKRYFLADCSKRTAIFGSYTSDGKGEKDLSWINVPPYNRDSIYGPYGEIILQLERICNANIKTR